jgi:tryptophan synthase alpha chain
MRMSEPRHAPHQRIALALRASVARGEPGLVAYLTAGFPRREDFRTLLATIAAQADVVEIGVPFTDPMADGVTIQRASEQALRSGVSLPWILDELQRMPRTATPLLLMSYFNPLLAYGLDALAAVAARGGVCGLIVPDLPFEESAPLRAALATEGLGLVQMVTPVTPAERLARVAGASEGFVYAVTMTGTTGRSVASSDPLNDYLARVRAVATVPVCAGFGIRTRAQVEALRGQVDGVIVGSALVETLERGGSPSEFLQSLRSRPHNREDMA